MEKQKQPNEMQPGELRAKLNEILEKVKALEERIKKLEDGKA